MTAWATTALVALVGAVIGSFLNVCIHRLPRDQSVVRPASACPACGRRLAWHDNVPLLSYLFLRGRCRSCRAPISVRYPIVEALTAAMFAAAWWHFGPGLLLVARLLFGSALIALFAIDLEHYLLPNAITLPGILVGFGFSFVTEPGWASSLAGIVIGGGSLYALARTYYLLRREEGLGMGDVKMLAMIGAFLGWQLTIMALLMASLAGSIIGLAIVATRRGGMKHALPFGTFLAVGAVLAVISGSSLLDWYVSLW